METFSDLITLDSNRFSAEQILKLQFAQLAYAHITRHDLKKNRRIVVLTASSLQALTTLLTAVSRADHGDDHFISMPRLEEPR
ncbi:MAG TPA: hypothetical protein GXX72_03480 [Clostridiaceae bacterium]|nr:hypothetical protein [Clostridiaceae bacterium]